MLFSVTESTKAMPKVLGGGGGFIARGRVLTIQSARLGGGVMGCV